MEIVVLLSWRDFQSFSYGLCPSMYAYVPSPTSDSLLFPGNTMSFLFLSLQVTYKLTKAGNYNLSISLHGTSVQFQGTCEPGPTHVPSCVFKCDPEHGRIRSDEEAMISITRKDAYGNQVFATQGLTSFVAKVTGPGPASAQVSRMTIQGVRVIHTRRSIEPQSGFPLGCGFHNKFLSRADCQACGILLASKLRLRYQ